jgi:hypothetical protein
LKNFKRNTEKNKTLLLSVFYLKKVSVKEAFFITRLANGNLSKAGDRPILAA